MKVQSTNNYPKDNDYSSCFVKDPESECEANLISNIKIHTKTLYRRY